MKNLLCQLVEIPDINLQTIQWIRNNSQENTKKEEGEYSPVITKVFFITDGNLHKYEDLTVISLVTPPESLIDPDTGIYITGIIYQEWKLTDDFDPYLKKWEEKTRSNYYMRGSELERRHLLLYLIKDKFLSSKMLELESKEEPQEITHKKVII